MLQSHGIDVRINVRSANRVEVSYWVAGCDVLRVDMDRVDGQIWAVGTYATDGCDYEGSEGTLSEVIAIVASGLARDLNPAF